MAQARTRTRGLLLLVLLLLVVLLGAFVYQFGMAHFEGKERSFLQAFSWSAETLTTTGYGADESWSHPFMVFFVAIFQFVGVFVVFLIVPLYLIPYLESRFQTRLPTTVPRLEGHVVIYGSDPAVDALLQMDREGSLRVVVVEEDEAAARKLLDRGVTILRSSLEEGALEACHLLGARALVANSSDERDAAVVLAARQLGFEGEVMALAEEPFHRQPLVLAGASVVFTPRHVLGAALAARASDRIEPQISGPQKIGRLEVRQVRIGKRSSLAGTTLGEAAIGARTGVTVIGQWVGGSLQVSPNAEMRLEPGGILVVVGPGESVAALSGLCADTTPLPVEGPFVVAGYGEVGRKVVQLLRDVGEDVQVIDREGAEGVEVVGDLLDPRTLDLLRLEEARAAVLALDSDSATLFATVILKDRFPDIPVIARVNETANLDRIHRAGADFALAVSLVSGQILARRLLGEEAVTIDERLKVLKVDVGGLAGESLGTARIRERTGCSVVAVERGQEVLVNLGVGFVFEEGDAIYVCGSDGAVKRFRELLA